MDGAQEFLAAPPLQVSQWFNTDTPISLGDLAGRVVAIEAFQMLCPGCVSHGLPQAQRIADSFGGEVTVLGLHTVFEHHEAMGPVSLEAFLYEYRIGFPVGVDAHDQPGGTPITMARYQLRGTPSLILIDRAGRIRLQRLRSRRRPHRRRRPGPPHRRTTARRPLRPRHRVPRAYRERDLMTADAAGDTGDEVDAYLASRAGILGERL